MATPERPSPASRHIGAATMKRHLQLVGSALWRAQASHLAVFVLAPVASALVQVVLGIVLLPFLLVGMGSTSPPLGAQVHHLASPSCWVALAPCPAAAQTVVALAEGATAAPADDELAALRPRELTLRHVWFVVWLGWFLVFLVRRERRR